MAEIQPTIHLEPDAAQLLAQLVPDPELRSHYVGDLIRAAAQMADLIEPANGSAGLQYLLASYNVLAGSWLGPEEDEAWRDLR